jgi:hypothetical protein
VLGRKRGVFLKRMKKKKKKKGKEKKLSTKSKQTNKYVESQVLFLSFISSCEQR